MRKERIKQIRNKMIVDLWEAKKNDWEMIDVAYLFGLEIAQIYRILKVEKLKAETKLKTNKNQNE